MDKCEFDLPPAYWSLPVAEVMRRLETSPDGLSADEAAYRLKAHGPNLLRPVHRTSVVMEFLGQFKSPFILLLIFAAGLSFFLQSTTDAGIIVSIVLLSGLLSFWQEHKSSDAMAKLLALVQAKARVLREATPQDITVEEVVSGDVVLLSAGDVIPADCLLLEHKDLFVDEAVLTGESYPVEKRSEAVTAETPLAQRTNVLFMGTHVSSGTGKAVAVQTGRATAFGQISEHLKVKAPETEFERGIRLFGYLLMQVTLVLVFSVFSINVYLHRPLLEAFLFALALAVGLTPQLLPAIISINLAQRAGHMAKQQVIVKRLAAIENLGSMDVLCSDKTGTITEGVMHLHSAVDVLGREWNQVRQYAYLNASLQSGYKNPIDAAITQEPRDVTGYTKLDELPDFIRRRLSVLVQHGDRLLLITKGAFNQVFAVCTTVAFPDGTIKNLAEMAETIRGFYAVQSQSGFRVLGVACKEMADNHHITKDDETGLTFLGFLLFHDPPKTGVMEAIQRLRELGVSFKIVTGDNQYAARYIWQQIGLPAPVVLTGSEMQEISSAALPVRAAATDIFAEVEPGQKERIILALQRAGHVVGYLGDGINDSPALYAADVGMSVNTAVDVAKEAAAFVLLEKDLNVLAAGILEGRRTFANTLKYVFMATSANFGNMFSMAGASLFLPFLPLLPTQVLLTNLLTDMPEMTIATDAVDQELV
ncbi:MAG TPA: magnesium-translocating P-type ATPase, partial [Firmicutes bacterium]|nr:magnesium-translocating P-type ATPase [Bacillota bacterium]